MRRTLVTIVIALVALGGAYVTPALGAGRPFTTALTGAQEVPGPGDPDASGTARLTLNPGREELCYDLAWADVDGTVQHAHVHAGSAGTAGPAAVTLFASRSFAGTGSDSACVSAPRSLLISIIQDPEGYYVNVHSTAYPAGAVRGQLPT